MIKETIIQHEKCIEILEAIQHFQAMIQHKNDSINGFGGSFKDLRNKYIDNIDTYQRCINRLKERYNKLIIKLN